MLIERVITYVKKKDNSVEVYYNPKTSTKAALQKELSAHFRYAEMKESRARLCFDFDSGCVRQEWYPLLVRQLDSLDDLQKTSVLSEIKKENFQMEVFGGESIDLETLRKSGAQNVWFSRYFQFSDEILYLSPEELQNVRGGNSLDA